MRRWIILLDITERKRTEAEIQRQLQHITARRAVDTAITTSLELRLTLNILLDQVMTQLRVDASSILLCGPQVVGTFPRLLKSMNEAGMDYPLAGT